MIDFRFLHYILPGLPMSKEKRAAIEVMTALKGGAGSGNFGHAGRPGEVGGSATGGGDVITNVTDKLGFDKSKIIIVDKIKRSPRKNSFVAAEYDPETKTIRLYKSFFENETLSKNAMTQQGILAHEIAHAKFHELSTSDWVDPLQKYGASIANQDEEWFDAIWRIGKDEPVSNYSKSYFRGQFGIDFKRYYNSNYPISETYSEVARMKIEGKSIPESWDYLYKETFK